MTDAQSLSTASASPGSPTAAIAAATAAEYRARQLPQASSPAQLVAEYERRQTFRRLIDPGILRPNSKEQAHASLKTLLTIAENLLREPENPKYQKFKPTNSVIKRDLVDPKGALEYAIELGFRPEVENFQPYYSFNPRKADDLKIGTAILREFYELESEKAEREARSKVDRKADEAARTKQAKLAFLDDRQNKMLKDEREKEQRAAKAAEPRNTTPQVPTPRTMPGQGNHLEGPPPHEPNNDND